MKENIFPKNNLGGRIEKMSIPDEDMAGWIKNLIEAGFSAEERDEIFIHLNKTYRDAKLSLEEQIEREIKLLEEEAYAKHKMILVHHQRENLRKIIKEKLLREKEGEK